MSRDNPARISYCKGEIKFDPSKRVAGGGFSELFRGKHPQDGTVALKRLRQTGRDPIEKHRAAVKREARLWRQLSNLNILPLLGILDLGSDEVYFVSPWADLGSLDQYIVHYPTANRIALLRDVAAGLLYLHESEIIHGDIKGTNALVMSHVRVVLCDFGLSKGPSIQNDTALSQTGGKGTIPWQSPEVMNGGPRTSDADVYAFGIMIYEIVSGEMPFARLAASLIILAVVNQNKRPINDSDDTLGDLSSIARRCWQTAVDDRPSMAQVVDAWPSSKEDEPDIRLYDLGIVFRAKYEQSKDLSHIRMAVDLFREALNLRPAGHPERSASLHTLAHAIYLQSENHMTLAIIREVISFYQSALDCYPDQIQSPVTLHNLANAFHTCYEIGRQRSDLNSAVKYHQMALERQGPEYPKLYMSVSNLAHALHSIYVQDRRALDLKAAADRYREAVAISPHTYPDLCVIFHNAGCTLRERYEQDHHLQDIQDAIVYSCKALDVCPARHPSRWVILNNLAFSHFLAYKGELRLVDLKKAVAYYREAVDVCPTDHAERWITLHNGACALQDLYEQENCRNDIEDAIAFLRKARQLCTNDDPRHLSTMRKLAHALRLAYSRDHRLVDIAEAAKCYEEVRKLCTPKSPDRFLSSRHAAHALLDLCKHDYSMSHLNNAIMIFKASLDNYPPGHTDRPLVLFDLAKALELRYQHENLPADNYEARKLRKEARRILKWREEVS